MNADSHISYLKTVLTMLQSSYPDIEKSLFNSTVDIKESFHCVKHLINDLLDYVSTFFFFHFSSSSILYTLAVISYLKRSTQNFLTLNKGAAYACIACMKQIFMVVLFPYMRISRVITFFVSLLIVACVCGI